LTQESYQVTFEQDGRRFQATGPDSKGIWIATKDILLNRSYEYLPAFELQNHTGFVVDAGAHVGVFSILASKFATKVLSIEPDPSNGKFLTQNLEQNDIRNVVFDKRALWHGNDKIKLFATGSSVNPSALIPRGESHEVDTVSLTELLERYGRIDLLKMNVEGAEYRIIENASPETLNGIDHIVAELHLLLGNPEPVLNKLKSAGFKIEWFYQPLYRARFQHEIRVRAARRLKTWRAMVYTTARLLRLKERRLCYLFAYRENS